MNAQRHAAIAEMLIETAASLAQDTRTGLAAGELIWGGIAHACNAADALVNAEHRELRTKRQWALVINSLIAEDGVRRSLLLGLDASQRLHDHFYTDRLNGSDLSEDIALGTKSIRLLLQIVSRAF